MKVLIIDSSVQVLDRLHEMLSENKKISNIEKTVSFDDAVELFLKNNHKIVLLDGNLLEDGTIKLLKVIKNSSTKTSVIILYQQYDEYLIEELKLNGADFIFDKYHEFEKISGVVNSIGSENNN